MKLSTRGQIASLARFKSNRFVTTSFYFNMDKGHQTKKQIRLTLKNLVNAQRALIDRMDLGRQKRESLLEDLERITRFGNETLGSSNHPGLAVFSCSGEDFWETFSLPDPPRNRIVFDQNPYVRPLSAILNEHHQTCVFLIDRKEAKWYGVFMGEISLLDHMVGDVPSKVREGGWEGYESKRIERHIATHLHDHFKKAAQRTFSLFKKSRFDLLLVGCQEECWKILEPLIHPYLKQKMGGKLNLKTTDSPTKVLKQVLALEKKIKAQADAEMVKRFISELEKAGLAVSGLKNTLRKLNRGEVQTLLVTRNFSKPGKRCPKCGFLFADEITCPSCQRKTEPLVDVIDEAVERAMDIKSRVHHINPPSRLSRYGNIGALLRYKS
ncbi:MAG: hypothetical protein ACE5LV_00720 [Candidatus Aminicenantales bacterium]